MNQIQIPDPVLERVDNLTGFNSFQFDKMAPGMHFCDVIVVKASFHISSKGIDSNPGWSEILMADEHREADNPLGSSLLQAGDLVVTKLTTDIIITGKVSVDKPQKNFVSQIVLKAASKQNPEILIDYACDVFGPRYWYAKLPNVWRMSEPAPTLSVPIQYELCWGGRRIDSKKPEDEWDAWEGNPSGSGFSFEHLKWNEEVTGIQWEPHSLMKNFKLKELTGFGPVARFWQSRAKYAGTYDKQWQEKLAQAVKNKDHLKGPVVMDYASDFDPKFFQAAHPMLQTQKTLNGDELLVLQNVIEGQGLWKANLPKVSVIAKYEHISLGVKQTKLNLDTVHIDTLSQKLNLTWRLTLPHSWGVKNVEIFKVEI
jgi:hypothetical protein